MKNNRFKKLAEIKGSILGIQMALKLLEDDLDAIIEQLNVLSKMEEDLEYNVKFLKKPEVISVITEHKKSITELKKVRSEIDKYKSLKNKIESDITKKFENYDYYIKEFENMYQDIEAEPVVLDFKGKNKNVKQ